MKWDGGWMSRSKCTIKLYAMTFEIPDGTSHKTIDVLNHIHIRHFIYPGISPFQHAPCFNSPYFLSFHPSYSDQYAPQASS
jgi:hypothetical protein